jgi:two-component system cell cycle response regulator CtrA
MRVLLIEDDSATAQSIELMLKSESFNVYTTDLGEEGVDLGKLYDYDIILLDLNLPDMSGYEVLRTLRLSKVKTPILILSGMAGIEDKVRGLGFGADDYMTKPFHKDELVARIHAIVRRSKGHAQSVIVDRRPDRQSRCQDGRSRRPARAPDRQGIPDAGAALAAQGHDAHQGNVPQPPLRRHGRAGTEDHRRLHLQAAQEARAAAGGQNYIETVWGRGYVLREPEAPPSTGKRIVMRGQSGSRTN